MSGVWVPGAGRNYPGNSAGSMNGDGSRKLGLHSTEGTSISGAVGSYTENNSWPHLTVDARRRVFEQHVSLDLAARSFRNLPGGADETNRDGNYMIQVELMGFAEHPETIGAPEDLDWLGRVVLGPAMRLAGVPIISTVSWLSYPASYGASPVRLSVDAWDAYSGVLGHQHVPDNVHGDPGAIDINRILNAARGVLPPPPPEEEDDDMKPHKIRIANTENYAYVLPDGLVIDRDYLGTPINGSEIKNFVAVYETDQANAAQVDQVQSAVKRARTA